MKITLPPPDEHILTTSSWRALREYTNTVGSKQSIDLLTEQIDALKDALRTSLNIEHGETRTEIAQLFNQRSNIERLNSVAMRIALNVEKYVFVPESVAANDIGMYALIANDEYGNVVRGGTFIYGNTEDEVAGEPVTWAYLYSPISIEAYKASKYRPCKVWAPFLA